MGTRQGESHVEAADKLTVVKREVTSAISNSRGLASRIWFWFDTDPHKRQGQASGVCLDGG
jgi:hypothetical protein